MDQKQKRILEKVVFSSPSILSETSDTVPTVLGGWGEFVSESHHPHSSSQHLSDHGPFALSFAKFYLFCRIFLLPSEVVLQYHHQQILLQGIPTDSELKAISQEFHLYWTNLGPTFESVS